MGNHVCQSRLYPPVRDFRLASGHKRAGAECPYALSAPRGVAALTPVPGEAYVHKGPLFGTGGQRYFFGGCAFARMLLSRLRMAIL
jgi:hypothetical protein